MKCPACDKLLTPFQAGKVTVDVCLAGCGGVWFDNFELQKVDKPDEFDAHALLKLQRLPKRNLGFRTPAPLPEVRGCCHDAPFL